MHALFRTQRLLITAASTALAAGGVLLPASAFAAPIHQGLDPNYPAVTVTSVAGTDTRSAPNTAAQLVWHLPSEVSVNVACTAAGTPVNGNSSWYQLAYSHQGFTEWVPAGDVRMLNGVPAPRSCLKVKPLVDKVGPLNQSNPGRS